MSLITAAAHVHFQRLQRGKKINLFSAFPLENSEAVGAGLATQPWWQEQNSEGKLGRTAASHTADPGWRQQITFAENKQNNGARRARPRSPAFPRRARAPAPRNQQLRRHKPEEPFIPNPGLRALPVTTLLPLALEPGRQSPQPCPLIPTSFSSWPLFMGRTVLSLVEKLPAKNTNTPQTLKPRHQ